MSTALERAKTVQRNVAEGTTVSIKLSLLEDLIAEIERLQKGNVYLRPNSVADIAMKHTGINHP